MLGGREDLWLPIQHTLSDCEQVFSPQCPPLYPTDADLGSQTRQTDSDRLNGKL